MKKKVIDVLSEKLEFYCQDSICRFCDVGIFKNKFCLKRLLINHKNKPNIILKELYKEVEVDK